MITHIGIGSIQKLKEILEKYNPSRIFLVYGKNSFRASGAERAIKPLLASYHVYPFSSFTKNPKWEDIKKGIEEFRNASPDVVIAVGGGSSMDTAKLINYFSYESSNHEDVLSGKIKATNKGKPLIAIPTTAGTGSEATQFAVVYRGGAKYSLDTSSILPEIALIDASLTFSMTSKVAASTGADALSQAVESYWSIRSTEESKKYAKEAILIILEYLSSSVVKGEKEARIKMSEAAYLAGKAINITRTTAPHAISYIISSRFNTPHGQAVILTLPSFFEYNYEVDSSDCTDIRGSLYVKNTIMELTSFFKTNDPYVAADRLRRFIKQIGLRTTLRELNVSKEDIPGIIQHVDENRLSNNPRKLPPSSLNTLLNNLYA